MREGSERPRSSLPEMEFPRIGGDAAADFLNTVAWRLDPDRARERLPTYLHLLAWMNEFGLLTASEVEALALKARHQPELASTELGLVIEMRDDTYAALNDGAHPGSLQDHLVAAHARSQLRRDPSGTWRWAPVALDLATPRHLLALQLARLMTSDAVVSFHRCEDPHCGYVFIDTSRQRNRRWCSSADCGNRNRVRTHYERSKGQSTHTTK